MAIPQTTADRILARCARHCCVCRKYRPLLLQVHHIKEQHDGGTHEEDNLIATCVNCHAEVHTETKLTRRFTERELKMHREDVYRLVAEGKLVEVADHEDKIDRLTRVISDLLKGRSVNPSPQDVNLLPDATNILITSASGDHGYISIVNYSGGFAVLATPRQFEYRNNPRKTAELRRAVNQLIENGLIETTGVGYTISLEGYRLADQLLAAASQPKEG